MLTLPTSVEADDKRRLLSRLRRIEGQVRGVQRMVWEEAHCVDTLTQVGSVVSALEQVASILSREHAERCVRESIAHQDEAEERMEEIRSTVQQFLRV